MINAWEKFDHLFKRINVPAKKILLREGEVSRKAYFIEKGCLRTWFNNNGKDVTFQFFFENEAVSSIESFSKGVPGVFNIETIEPCTLRWIHKNDFEKIIAQSPEIRMQMAEINLERQFVYMHQFLSFLKDIPPQRYANLLNEKPHILQRVPLQYIASYLGITPVSLSRIRNKK
jgi:CRP-like cAMP-binding protein